jgi:cytidine deaminase
MYPDAKIIQMAITAASDTNKTEAPIPPAVLVGSQLQNIEIKQVLSKYTFMGESGDIYKSTL